MTLSLKQDWKRKAKKSFKRLKRVRKKPLSQAWARRKPLLRVQKLDSKKASEQLKRLFPNLLTVCALSFGLSSLRFSFEGLFERAAVCILIGALLDMLDGRVARFLGSDSDFGAELDSLADFLCYGVAPALLCYVFTLSVWPSLGWAVCLFYATCAALRLARFNVYRLRPEVEAWQKDFFVGVPAPAASLIALLPLFIHFTWGMTAFLKGFFLMSLLLSGALMIARFPTLALKNYKLSPRHIPFFLMGFAVLVGVFLSEPWVLLSLVVLAYMVSLPLVALWVRRLKKRRAPSMMHNYPLKVRLHK